MATTFTATGALAEPRLQHIGVNAAKANLSISTATTFLAADIVLGPAIPNGVTIIDGYMSGTIDNDATGTDFKVGLDTVSNDNLATALTLNNVASLQRFNAGTLPVTLALTETDEPLQANVQAEVTSGGTEAATVDINIVVLYAGPGSI